MKLIPFLLLTGLVSANPEEPATPEPAPAPESDPVVQGPPPDADPFADDYAGSFYSSVRRINPDRAGKPSDTVLVRFESFDVPTLQVITLLDQWDVQAGADSLREQILAMVKRDEASVIEAKAATVEAGTEHSLEAIHEYTYPTEYEPPEGVPLPLTTKDKPETPLEQLSRSISNTACPTAFETRNTGSTFAFEVVPVTAEDNTWDLSISPETVELDGQEDWGQEGLQIQMPRFNSIRTSTVVRVRDNIWTLVSSQGPPAKKDEPRQSVKRLVLLKVQKAR